MAFHIRKIRALLLLALTTRICVALRFSYLHPDEHMQGPGEIAHGVYGWASQVPWEFKPENAVRSFVPLWLIYGLPMCLFGSHTNPVYVLYALRILCMTLTWVLEDMAISRLAPTKNDKMRCLLFVSTSYVTLTWQAHTLSNSFETILLLWFLVILYEAESATTALFRSCFNRHYDNALLGIITILGVFNRPTFLGFLLVPSVHLFRLWCKFPGTFITFAISAGLMLAGCVYVDTLLYNEYGGNSLVFAPLNFIKYNLTVSNLAEHGLHSRFTHLLVNLPVLIGPGLLILKPNWKSLAIQSTVGALITLSLIPHQEARFLLPIVPLLCCQMDLDHFKSPYVRKILLNLWLIFNVAMCIFMGFFHQAGVVPAQLYIRELPRPSTIIWWKTYTPPLWVLGSQPEKVDYIALTSLDNVTVSDVTEKLSNASRGDVLTVVDLQGSSLDVLKSALEAARQPFYVVAPLARELDLNETLSSVAAIENTTYSLDPVWTTVFHVDPDQIDLDRTSTLRPGLSVFNVTR